MANFWLKLIIWFVIEMRWVCGFTFLSPAGDSHSLDIMHSSSTNGHLKEGTLFGCIAVLCTMYVDANYCYRPSSVVCLSVTVVSLAKTAELFEMLFGLWTWMGPGKHVLNGVQIAQYEWAIF